MRKVWKRERRMETWMKNIGEVQNSFGETVIRGNGSEGKMIRRKWNIGSLCRVLCTPLH
jgi:hypothetical protein